MSREGSAVVILYFELFICSSLLSLTKVKIWIWLWVCKVLSSSTIKSLSTFRAHQGIIRQWTKADFIYIWECICKVISMWLYVVKKILFSTRSIPWVSFLYERYWKCWINHYLLPDGSGESFLLFTYFYWLLL